MSASHHGISCPFLTFVNDNVENSLGLWKNDYIKCIFEHERVG